MKISSQAGNRSNKAFTLIEMIGVLAVIAILAAVLIPKVFQAINDSRINNAAMTCQTVKTALIDHYAKYGSLTAGLAAPGVALNVPTNNFDKILLSETFLDKPFAVKIGDNSTLNVIEMDSQDVAAGPTIAPTVASGVAHVTGSATFNLDGAGVINDATGSAVVYAVITGVNLNDARDLNARIDGSAVLLGENSGLTGASTVDATASDVSGRVKYTFAGATATVYVYLTHR